MSKFAGENEGAWVLILKGFVGDKEKLLLL
jgi:hypothetical protein